MTRNRISTALLVLMLPIMAYVWFRPANNGSVPISAVGGEEMFTTNSPLPACYLQTDSKWGEDPVGGSGEPLARVGCTVCCVSMAATQLGYPIDPKALNEKLLALNGYTDRGWLKWKVATAATDGSITFDIPRKPTHQLIDEALRSGNPVITKILLRDTIPHWVLIVGKSGQDYLILDPLEKSKTLKPLSNESRTIQSIRVAKRKAKSAT